LAKVARVSAMPTPFQGQTQLQVHFGRELGNLWVHIEWAKEFDLA
jgi:hypothetical protein